MDKLLEEAKTDFVWSCIDKGVTVSPELIAIFMDILKAALTSIKEDTDGTDTGRTHRGI